MSSINLQFQLSVENEGFSASNATNTKSITPESGITGVHHTKQAVTTGEADVGLGAVDVAEDHMIQLVNLGSVNITVKVRKDGTPTDTEVGKILPGACWGPVLLPAQTAGYPKLRVVTTSGSANMEIVVAGVGTPA
jgi:hypothetical protein